MPGPTSGEGFDPSFVSTSFPEPGIPDPETVYTDPDNIDADFSMNLSDLVAADTNDLVTLLFFPIDLGNRARQCRTQDQRVGHDYRSKRSQFHHSKSRFRNCHQRSIYRMQQLQEAWKGDFDGNGIPGEPSDYAAWLASDGSIEGYLEYKGAIGSAGSGNGTGGAIPEPTSVVLAALLFGLLTVSCARSLRTE